MNQRWNALLVKAACVFVGVAASLSAQQSIDSDPVLLLRADAKRRADWATEWLHSEDPLRVAWGAWLARQDRQTALIPLLIKKVEEYQSAEQSPPLTVERDRHDALLVVLDAVIGLGAILPVKEARKLYPEFAAQSLILLVRSHTDAVPALLDIFRNARANWDWLAAGNVLAGTRPPGFAALLLSRFTQHVTMSVVDGGFGGASGGGGSECGFSLRAPKARWPFVGLYLLTQFPDRMQGQTATFLVSGETTVYYWRVEPGNYDNPPDTPGSCDDGDRDRYRAQYLSRLMESSFPRMSIDPYPQVTIVWKGEADYRQQFLAALQEQRSEFGRAVASLQESGRVLMPAESATWKPRLEIVIRDERADRSTPLPGVLENDGTVSVRSAFTKPLY
ncbi:MAG: hypothetical protein ACJ72H_13655 [Candidatus Sulfotelmatobacter sp.]